MKKTILMIATLFTLGFAGSEAEARTFRVMGAASMTDGDDETTTITCRGSEGVCLEIISKKGKITLVVYTIPGGGPSEPGSDIKELEYGARSTVNGYLVDELPDSYVSPDGVYVIENED